MTDRPFADAGDPAVAPGPGYYPDPSIPGFVRYWGGSAWVPGTSRPAPAEGEVLEPPRYATRRPAPGAPAARTVPPPVAPAAAVPVPVPTPVSVPEAEPPAGGGDTGPVYFDQTSGGASFVLGPRVAEVIGGPVFRTVGPTAGGGASEEAPEAAAGAVVGAAAGAGVEPGDSGWQADPRAQRGLTETGGAPRWVSWGVLPGASEAEEGRAEPQRAPAAVESAAAVAPAVAVAVREAPTPTVEASGAVPVVAQTEPEVVASGSGPRAAVRSEEPAAATASTTPMPAVRPTRQAAARRRSAASAPAVVPAGLGRRLAARAVDTAVLLVVAVAAGIPLGRSVSDHLQQKLDQARMASALTRRQIQVWLVDDVVAGKIAVLIGILLFVSLLYEVLPTARTGQTFGKRLARVRVVDAGAKGKARLSLGRSLLRWVVRQVGAVLLLGLVWPVFDRPTRRGWQDRAARTKVVRA